MAYIVAIHEIADPERFWGTSLELPSDVKLHSSFPREGGSRAVCLWEADSADTVRTILDDAAGDFSRNEFFEVDTAHPGTTGLPAVTTAGA